MIPVTGMQQSPVAIGGIGGSGTRLVAGLLMELGYHMGSCLNPENDNLFFTLIFKRPDILTLDDRAFAELLNLFLSTYTGHGTPPETVHALVTKLAAEHPQHWVKPVEEALHATLRDVSLIKPSLKMNEPWGWKEPNTHLILDQLYQGICGLKYIHVIRNGLDMAYSSNQRQARLWGAAIVGYAEESPSPRYLLKYWCKAHQRVMNIQAARIGRNAFYLLNFDRLCRYPVPVLTELFAFLEQPLDATLLGKLSALVKPPASLGRHQATDLTQFDSTDLDYLVQTGFSID